MRRRRVRQWRGQMLTESMRYFLQSGDICLRERFPHAKDRLEIFVLGKRESREKLCRIWLHFRDEIMADWTRQGCLGVPWAEDVFSQPVQTYAKATSEASGTEQKHLADHPGLLDPEAVTNES